MMMVQDKATARRFAVRRLKLARGRQAAEMKRGNAAAAIKALVEADKALDILSALGPEMPGEEREPAAHITLDQEWDDDEE